MNRPLSHRCAAELAGTALLVGIGTGAVVLSARSPGAFPALLALAWFVAVFLPIVLVVRVSGAHLNPAVTLALAASGRAARRDVPPYVASQVAGAFVGSAAVATFIGRAAHLGATVPRIPSLVLAMGAEAAFTALLVASVFALSDLGEGPRRWRLTLPAAAVAVSTWAIGPWTGSSLNPARSVAPAVLSGTYTDLWAYVLTVALSGLAVALVWRARPTERLRNGTRARIDASDAVPDGGRAGN